MVVNTGLNVNVRGNLKRINHPFLGEVHASIDSVAVFPLPVGVYMPATALLEAIKVPESLVGGVRPYFQKSQEILGPKARE